MRRISLKKLVFYVCLFLKSYIFFTAHAVLVRTLPPVEGTLHFPVTLHTCDTFSAPPQCWAWQLIRDAGYSTGQNNLSSRHLQFHDSKWTLSWDCFVNCSFQGQEMSISISRQRAIVVCHNDLVELVLSRIHNTESSSSIIFSPFLLQPPAAEITGCLIELRF